MSDPSIEADDADATEGSGVSIVEILRFVLQAARRHLWLCLGVLVLSAAAGITISLIIPPMYEASAKILVTQEGNVTSALSNPDFHGPSADPHRGLSEIVLRTENLRAIATEANLLKEWDAHRPPVLKVKDQLMELIFGPLPDDEKLRAIVGVLEHQMHVYSEGSGTIRIGVLWRDAATAAKIVNVAKRRFLEQRMQQETSVITAAIDILENEVRKAGEGIDPHLKRVQELREALAAERKPAARKVADEKPAPTTIYEAAPSAPRAKEPDPAISLRLEKIRQEIHQAQDPWQRRLADLKLQLVDLRGVYGPKHPAVLQQERRIADASQEPPVLAKLRQQEQQLLSQLEEASAPAAGGATRRRVSRAASGDRLSAEEAAEESASFLEDSPQLAAERSKLMNAVHKYNDLIDRIDRARLELTTAEAAFKYRYVVVQEPEAPRKPVKPNRRMLILASLGGALMLGLLAGAARELATGRVIEAWQVKQLGVPLLADIDLSAGRDEAA